eukprot:5806938-Pyramimonas_sp.AAC.2
MGGWSRSCLAGTVPSRPWPSRAALYASHISGRDGMRRCGSSLGFWALTAPERGGGGGGGEKEGGGGGAG